MSLSGATRYYWPESPEEWSRISNTDAPRGEISSQVFDVLRDHFHFSPSEIHVPIGRSPEEPIEQLQKDSETLGVPPTLAGFHDFYDDPRPIMDHKRLHSLELAEIYQDRLDHNRDLHVLMSAINHGTGLGKSTLSIHLGRFFTKDKFTDRTFKVEEHATFDADEYQVLYDECSTGSVLLFDDVERELNRRRAMSSKNVDVITMLEGMRYRQHTTLFITPGRRSVDRMLEQLADLWIHVQGRGRARVYRPYINEFGSEDEIGRKYLHDIYWDPLDDDEEYQRLEKMKKEAMQGNVEIERYNQEDLEKARSKAEERVRKEVKQSLAERMADGDYTQAEIARLMEVDQSTISRWV